MATKTVDQIICSEADILRRRGEHDQASRVLELRYVESDTEDIVAQRALVRAEEYARTGETYAYALLKLALYRWKHGKSDAELTQEFRERLSESERD
jgi:hypothetical protein